MNFATWFRERWRTSDENETRAIARLSLASGCAPMTLRRALAGKPVRAATAEKLAALTGGAVTRESLAFGTGPAEPSANAEPKASEPAAA